MKKCISRLTVLLLILVMTLTSAMAVFAEGAGSGDSGAENEQAAAGSSLGEASGETGGETGTGEEDPEPADPDPQPEPDPEPEPEPHVHSYGAWTVSVQPTYFSPGTMVRYCSCGAYETQPVAKLTAVNQWISEGGRLFYFGSNGVPYTGWHKMKPHDSRKTKWCYFADDGAYVKSIKKNTKKKWVKAGGYKFYFTKKKKPAGPGFIMVKKKMYYLDSRGAVVYGTFTASDGNTYTTAKNGSISGLAYYKYKYKTFILVDISEQTIWYYKKGKQVIKSDVVTGQPGSYNTPTGVFKIRSKQRNITLTGPTWNSFVSYWMAFKGSSYGLHDASWRSSSQFSNHKTYLSNGSHGCINLRPSVAASLYGMVKTGTTVIVQN